MDHPMDDNTPPTQYAFYQQDQYQLPYGPYHRLPDQLPYHNLAILPQPHYSQPQAAFNHPHVHPHPHHTPPPPSPELYDPLSPNLSGSDSSADAALYHPSNSASATTTTSNSTPNSPSSSRHHSLVHRTPRYNPSPSPTSSSAGTGRRRRSHSQDSDDDDFTIANTLTNNNNNMGSAAFTENLAHSRKEATRKQRIEAEQRRRDELRDGYAKLKDALPVSNQKSSKVSLLERAVNHIMTLEKENKELQAHIASLEQESNRLRSLNEKISLHSEGTASPEPGAARHNTTTPDALSTPNPVPPTTTSALAHSLTSVRGQRPPSEHSSPSASEQGH